MSEISIKDLLRAILVVEHGFSNIKILLYCICLCAGSLQIYPGLSCLRMLKGAFDVVMFTVFDEIGSGLLEPEGYLFLFTNPAKSHHPVGRQALSQTVYPLRNHQELKIAPLADHLPGIGAPWIGILHKEIGSKAGVDQRARGNFVLLVAFSADRRIEAFCLRNHRAVYISPGIPTVYVAMATTLT